MITGAILPTLIRRNNGKWEVYPSLICVLLVLGVNTQHSYQITVLRG